MTDYWASFAATGSPSVCRFAFASNLAGVEIDEGQIGQLIHNLVLNATQAMPHGGTITVSAANVAIDAATAPRMTRICRDESMPSILAGKPVTDRMEGPRRSAPTERPITRR